MENAKRVIKDYLDRRAAEDEQFAIVYAKKDKNIDQCFSYILGEARRKGTSVCMTDEEVFGLAVHYYDEDDIKINRVVGGATVSATKSDKSAKVELTEEEKAKAKEEALSAYREECLKKQIESNRNKPGKNKIKQDTPSLFAL